MRIRAIDAGGSCTRIARSKDEIFKIPSTCMEIPIDAPEKKHIIEDGSLDFCFKKCPSSGLVGRRFVKGEAMNQYTGDVLVCDNQIVKVLQEVTYINILYSIAADCLRRDLNYQEFKIGLCIPAAEFYDDTNDRINDVKDGIAGETAIYFPMLDKTISFTIDKTNIGVVAEGVVAAFKFKGDRDFVTRNSVIVDVGYRSTDITILLSFKPVGASAASRPIGGVNLEAAIQSQLERDNIFASTDTVRKALCGNFVLDENDQLVDVTSYIEKARTISGSDYLEKAVSLANMDGLKYSKNEMLDAVKSSYMVQGQDVIDITDYVHKAKEMFVDAVFKSIQAVANAKMMNISEISNVMCVGRPFSGDLSDEYNLVNMLRSKFKDDVSMYCVPDTGTANVSQIIRMLGTES